jgi:2-polyprenyl-6-methoxyphenol hydroxylase-like FAD-dependent oxidoreductase
MTAKPIGSRAVVIGAGIAGLAAAGALAEFFGTVEVLERDQLPPDASPRRGVPQGRHLHALLGGGLEALSALFPNFEGDLANAGAVPIRVTGEFREEFGGVEKPRRDFGWVGSMQSRPLLELAIRGALSRHRNVILRTGCRVRALDATPDGARVTGVRIVASNGATEALEADLVVDASGRGTPTVWLLQALGRPRPKEIEIGVDLGYASALFKLPEDASRDWLALYTHADAPRDTRSGVMNLIEDDLWILTLIGRGDAQPPTDPAGFMAFARQLASQTIFSAIKNAEMIGGVSRFVFPGSIRRTFDLATSPERLIVIGDALCRFNPVYGQGIMVAAWEAVRLKQVLQAARPKGAPLAGAGRQFQVEAQRVIDGPWQMSAIPDFIYPATRGERPADFAETIAYQGALLRLAARDPAIDKLVTQVWHLLQPPSILQDPELVARVKAEMAAQEAAA